MKKRLLAILLSAAMVVCLMPTMAFATEELAPAEEPAVEEVKEEAAPVVEEPAVEEAAEEVVEEAAPAEEAKEEEAVEEEPAAELAEETAELEERKVVTGTWDGYKCTVKKEGLEEEDVVKAYVISVPSGTVDKDTTITPEEVEIKDGILDVTEQVNKVFETGHTCLVAIVNAEIENEIKEEGISMDLLDYVYNAAAFLKIDTTVSVDSAATKDTTFNYGIDSYLNLQYKVKKSYPRDYDIFEEINDSSVKRETEGATIFGEGFGCELVKDSIVLGKGDKSADDYLALRINANIEEAMESINDLVRGKTYKQSIGLLIGEKSNDGGYDTSSTLWMGIPNPEAIESGLSVMTGLSQDTTSITVPENLMAWQAFESADAADSYVTELNAMIKKLSAKNLAATLEQLKADFSETELSFNRSDSGKGVQTGDSNELGLWIALAVITSAAAAAYALKRREN